MKANLTIPDVAFVEDVHTFSMKLGKTFRLDLLETGGPVEWFSNNDDMLDINESGDEFTSGATIVATEVGAGKIKLMRQDNILMTLNVDVFGDEAESLNLSAGDEEPKAGKKAKK